MMQAINIPTVSVIIPCYNRERFIAETVDSVLAQTWPKIEIIVVDDGSTDGSRGILQCYGDKITILQHEGRANLGQSASINLGIMHCSGEYVAVLDSDDLFAPDKVTEQVTFLNSHPDVGLVYANGHVIDHEGRLMYPFYGHDHVENSDPNKVLLNCYFLVPNNSLIRKQVFRQCGLFDEKLRASQDHDMAIRIAEVTKIAYISQYLFFYRRHTDSISYKNVKLRWLNGYKILFKAYRRYPYPMNVIFGRFAVLNFRMAQCYKEEKKYVRSLLMLLMSAVFNPSRAIKVLSKQEPITGHH